MKNRSIEIKWAVIFAAVGLIWFVLEKGFGLHAENINIHPIATNFFMIPAIIIFVLALKEKKKKDFNGQISYIQCLVSGIIISLIVGILSIGTQYIFSNFISPEYFENAINYGLEQGHDEVKLRQQFNPKTYLFIAPIFAVFAGIITTAVISIFLRTKN